MLSSTKQEMTIFGRDQIELLAQQVAKGKIM
jgi:hypothetical protein